MPPARPVSALRTSRLTAWTASFALAPMVLAAGLVLAGGAAALAQVSDTRVQEFSYDPTTGLLIEQVSEPDNPAIALTTTYTYDGFGNQLTSTVSGPDIVSRTTSATYSADGRFAETVTNALGHTETHVTDPAFGNTTSLTGPNSLTTTWEYDGFGRKTKELRADGTETRWSYELCVSQCPAGAVYLVSSQEFISSSSTATTAKAIEYLDALNRVFRSEGEGFDGTPVYVDTVFNARGQVIEVSKPYFQGAAAQDIYWTLSAYDIVGRRTSVTLPDAGVETTAFDGLTTTLENALLQQSVRVENALGELVSATDNLGYQTTYEYDPFGNLTETDAEGVVTSMTYDVRGLKIAMDDPDMGQWSYSYNALGELVSQTDAKGQVTTMAYDLLGRMVSRTDDDGGPNEATTTWTYDSAVKGIGKIASVAAPSINYAESMVYDGLGRPSVASLTFEGETYDTQTFYDAAGRADSLAYPSGFLVKSVFTSNGHLAAVTDEFATTTYWQADTVNAEGQVTAETLGNGVTTSRVYDPATSRIDSILTTAGATTVQDLGFDFDMIGNLTARQDLRQDREEAFTYDDLNRVTGTTLTTIGPPPSAPELLLQADFNSGTNGFNYYDGRFGGSTSNPFADGIRDNSALKVTLMGAPAPLSVTNLSGGWQKNFTVPSEMEVFLSFDYDVVFAGYDSDEYSQVLISLDGGAPILVEEFIGDGTTQAPGQQTYTTSLGTLAAGNYSIAIGSYNNKGTDFSERTEIWFDNVEVTGTPGGGGGLATLNTTTYSYDSLGNLTYKSDLGSYIYGTGAPGQPGPHAVVTAGTKSYTYDANGSMISGDNKTTGWTSFNKPQVITDSLNSNESLFVYGPSRARVKHRITDGGLVTNMFYVGSHYERKTRSGEDDELVHYIRAGGSVVAIYTEYRDAFDAVTTSKTRYLHRDHLGSVESITDETGTVTERFSYDPHGKRRETDWTPAVATISGSETPRGFTGHEHLDAVGLIHMNGRVYDPLLGRFLSADPFVQHPQTTQGFNRYSYTDNNPLSYTDPSGFGWLDGREREQRGTPANDYAKDYESSSRGAQDRAYEWGKKHGINIGYSHIDPGWANPDARTKNAIEDAVGRLKDLGTAITPQTIVGITLQAVTRFDVYGTNVQKIASAVAGYVNSTVAASQGTVTGEQATPPPHRILFKSLPLIR